jgi:hypothetical protein
MGRQDWTDEKLFERLLHNKSDKTYWDNIRILRLRPTPSVFSKCVEFINSTNTRKRRIGVDILAQLGHSPRPFVKQSIKFFFTLLEKERNVDVLTSLLYAIGHNNESLKQSQVDKVSKFKNHPDKVVRQSVVSALLGIDNNKAFHTLIYLSNDKVASIKDWATFGLGTQIDNTNARITNALWERINDKHNNTRLEAIAGLAKRRDKRIKEVITATLNQGEAGSLLFDIIVELGDPSFIPFLKKQLKIAKLDKTINHEWISKLYNCLISIKKEANHQSL